MNTDIDIPWWIGTITPDNKLKIYDRQEQLEQLFDRAYMSKLSKNPERYWTIVGEVWKRTEFPCFQAEAWLDVFSATPGVNAYTRLWLKNPQRVYRGRNAEYASCDCDWSWTTDLDKAWWFARRFGSKHAEVIEFDTRSDPSRVWCVFENDPENEVLLWSPTAYEFVHYPEDFEEAVE